MSLCPIPQLLSLHANGWDPTFDEFGVKVRVTKLDPGLSIAPLSPRALIPGKP